MRTFRFTLEYDGSGFEGWQIQRDGVRTVQGTLRDALEQVTGEAVAVIGAGRTDAGVHAEAQVATASLATGLAPDVLRRALNANLPPDLAVAEARVVADGFHPIRDARGKLYRYAVWNGPGRSPLRTRTHLFVSQPLDLPAMREAAGHLLGSHDFAAFRAAGSDVQTSQRTLLRLDVDGVAGREVLFWVEGTGFLRHMVRILVGTLLQVGRGRRPAGEVADVLASRDRVAAGPTAPPHGLTLVRVDYPDTDFPCETDHLGPRDA